MTQIKWAGLFVVFVLVTAVVGLRGQPPADPKGDVPKAPAPDIYGREIKFPGDLVISTNSIAKFEFGQGQYDILVTKQFMTQFNGQAVPVSPTPEQQRAMKAFMFYIPPTVAVTPADAKAAVEQAKFDEDAQRFRAQVAVDLFPKDARVAAMNLLNDRYPEAKLTPDNIALVGYEYLEVWKGAAGKGTRVLALPDITPRTLARLSTTPTVVAFDVYGTKEELHAFADNPEFTVRYGLGGLTVKQDLLVFNSALFVQTGLHQFLTGDANWELKDKAFQETEMGGGLFGALERVVTGAPPVVKRTWTRGTKVESWVSRDQVKELTQRYVDSAGVVLWSELGPKPKDADRLKELAAKMTDSFTTQLMEGAASKEFAFEEVNGQKTFVLAPELTKDFEPTVIKEINDGANARLKTVKKVDIKVIEVVEAKKETEYDEGNGRVWSFRGEAAVPKRVRLYQLNRAQFAAAVTRTFTQIQATATGAVFDQKNQSRPFERLGNMTALGSAKEVSFAAGKKFVAETDGIVVVRSGGADHAPANDIRIVAGEKGKEELVGHGQLRDNVVGFYGTVIGVVPRGQNWSVELRWQFKNTPDVKVTELRNRSSLSIKFIPFTLLPVPAPAQPQK